jgi:hypothetical protein
LTFWLLVYMYVCWVTGCTELFILTVKSNCCGFHKNSFRFSFLIRLSIWYDNSKIYSADLLDSISLTVHAGWFWYNFHQLGACIIKMIYMCVCMYIYIYRV